MKKIKVVIAALALTVVSFIGIGAVTSSLASAKMSSCSVNIHRPNNDAFEYATAVCNSHVAGTTPGGSMYVSGYCIQSFGNYAQYWTYGSLVTQPGQVSMTDYCTGTLYYVQYNNH